jgi:hypothetical protein
MKYILLFATALVFSACSHGWHHHDGHACCQKEAAAGCCKEMKGDCCAKKEGSRACCSAEGQCSKASGGEASCKMDASVAVQAPNAAIAKDMIAKLYKVNKKKLGPTCAAAASAYCGKVTRDLQITEEEFSCLMGKATRSTKEALPSLDGTECATMLQKLAKSTEVAPAKAQ